MTGFRDYKNTPFTLYILPVIPRGEPLSPECGIEPERIGKIPGYRDKQGLWHGFLKWSTNTATDKMLDAWARMYAPPLVETVCMRTVDYPCLDSDVEDAI